MFKYADIQLFRSLSEQEVLEVNHITKNRAFRYIAGAQRDWLYPECHLPSTHWRKLGGGYLLMPEPRGIYMGGQIYIGYKNGRSDAFSEYGHKPEQRGFENEDRQRVEGRRLEQFKAEFARMQGPAWRGTSWQFGRKGPHVDRPEFYERYLEQAPRYRNEKKGARDDRVLSDGSNLLQGAACHRWPAVPASRLEPPVARVGMLTERDRSKSATA